eukprot:755138-Hanusia_phi.AAC.5
MMGRGRPLFGEPNYESKMASMATGVPVVGCFYNGERGKGGGRGRGRGMKEEGIKEGMGSGKDRRD